MKSRTWRKSLALSGDGLPSIHGVAWGRGLSRQLPEGGKAGVGLPASLVDAETDVRASIAGIGMVGTARSSLRAANCTGSAGCVNCTRAGVKPYCFLRRL